LRRPIRWDQVYILLDVTLSVSSVVAKSGDWRLRRKSGDTMVETALQWLVWLKDRENCPTIWYKVSVCTEPYKNNAGVFQYLCIIRIQGWMCQFKLHVLHHLFLTSPHTLAMALKEANQKSFHWSCFVVPVVNVWNCNYGVTKLSEFLCCTEIFPENTLLLRCDFLVCLNGCTVPTFSS
jgi:hypothetical protein